MPHRLAPDVEIAAASKTVVSFDANGGKFDDNTLGPKSLKADENGYVSEEDYKDLGTPVNENSEFGGWYLTTAPSASTWQAVKNSYTERVISINGTDTKVYFIDDISGFEFKAPVTAYAKWNTTRAIKVTFDYGTWQGAPDDVTVKVQSDEAIDVNSVIKEKPSREGYLFLGWTRKDNGAVYKTTDLAGKFFAGTNDYTLLADWVKPGTKSVEDAMKYIVAVDDKFVNGDKTTSAEQNATAFTSASWDEYTADYKNILVEYKQAKGNQLNGSIREADATKILKELNDAWAKLRFNNGTTDTTIDGHKPGADVNAANRENGAEIVYRLATPNGQRHFLTADENEVLARTNTVSGLPAWKLEPASSFRMVNRRWVQKAAAGDQGEYDKYAYGYETDAAEYYNGIDVTPALVKTVTRLYNSVNQEHLYTTDENEVKTLTNGSNDWSVDSSAADLYTPALYTTSREVARFYNKATGLHFYTTDKAEINFWTVQHPGIWQKEATGIYAL